LRAWPLEYVKQRKQHQGDNHPDSQISHTAHDNTLSVSSRLPA
jgi:hypothetical protein